MTIRTILECNLPTKIKEKQRILLVSIRKGQKYWTDTQNTLYVSVASYSIRNRRFNKWRKYDVNWMSEYPKVAVFFWTEFESYKKLFPKLKLENLIK